MGNGVDSDPRTAVLVSGGLDSALLLLSLAEAESVVPVYVRFGLAWEAAELCALERFLDAARRPSIARLVTLDLPVAAIYGEHWSVTGRGVPDDASPDDAVHLPGRNLLLIGLAGVWCALHGVDRIAIGTLDANPFPDATPDFFRDYARLMSGALGHAVEVLAPFRGRDKSAIIAAHPGAALELTLSCVAPRDGVHCGACNKCHERRVAFERAGITDPTRYRRGASSLETAGAD